MEKEPFIVYIFSQKFGEYKTLEDALSVALGMHRSGNAPHIIEVHSQERCVVHLER